MKGLWGIERKEVVVEVSCWRRVWCSVFTQMQKDWSVCKKTGQADSDAGRPAGEGCVSGWAGADRSPCPVWGERAVSLWHLAGRTAIPAVSDTRRCLSVTLGLHPKVRACRRGGRYADWVKLSVELSGCRGFGFCRCGPTRSYPTFG